MTWDVVDACEALGFTENPGQQLFKIPTSRRIYSQLEVEYAISLLNQWARDGKAIKPDFSELSPLLKWISSELCFADKSDKPVIETNPGAPRLMETDPFWDGFSRTVFLAKSEFNARLFAKFGWHRVVVGHNVLVDFGVESYEELLKKLVRWEDNELLEGEIVIHGESWEIVPLTEEKAIDTLRRHAELRRAKHGRSAFSYFVRNCLCTPEEEARIYWREGPRW